LLRTSRLLSGRWVFLRRKIFLLQIVSLAAIHPSFRNWLIGRFLVDLLIQSVAQRLCLVDRLSILPFDLSNPNSRFSKINSKINSKISTYISANLSTQQDDLYYRPSNDNRHTNSRNFDHKDL
ncbi:hypothetical protein BGX21_006020, partial [Mortierella sp. AD011]